MARLKCYSVWLDVAASLNVNIPRPDPSEQRPGVNAC
jgi:hypothetical protein